MSENTNKNKSSIIPPTNNSKYDLKNISYEGNGRSRGRLNINTNMTKLSDPGHMTNYGFTNFKKGSVITVTPNSELRNSIDGRHGSHVYKTNFPKDSKFSLRNMAPVGNRRSFGVASANVSHSENYIIGNKNEQIRSLLHTSERTKNNRRDPGHIPVACTFRNNNRRDRLSSAMKVINAKNNLLMIKKAMKHKNRISINVRQLQNN
jgi:hypothetical protein